MKRTGFQNIRMLALVTVVLTLVSITGCWIGSIDIPYRTQETSYWCGAACAQMILKCPKINVDVDQATLYNYIHSHNTCTSGWASDPKGLELVLDHYGNSHSAWFQVSGLSNQDDAVKKLADTIDKFQVPPASLIYGCGHWVVVRGVFTDNRPSTSPSFTTYGVYVNDPWYGSTSLGENKYVDVATWKADYFTGCTWCGLSGSRYISVVDPNPVPAFEIKYPRNLPRRAQIISPAEITRMAGDYKRRFEAEPTFRQRFAAGIAATRNAQFGTPLLVRRSDRQNDAYYIVTLNTGGLTAGALMLDAYSGQLKEATYPRKAVRYLPELDRGAAQELFLRKVPKLEVRPEVLRQLNVRETPPPANRPQLETPSRTFDRLDISASDVRISNMELTWAPTVETQNPYYPVWTVKGTVTGTRQAEILGFVTPRGEVFSRLTQITGPQGGGAGH